MQEWIDARRRRHLSHSQVQMARELGLNPAKLGKIDNHKQEPWKLPLPRFIEQLYFERFGKTTPDKVVSIEERCRLEEAHKAARRAARQQRAKSSRASSVCDVRDRAVPPEVLTVQPQGAVTRGEVVVPTSGGSNRDCRPETGALETGTTLQAVFNFSST
jgi:hypothetical protein